MSGRFLPLLLASMAAGCTMADSGDGDATADGRDAPFGGEGKADGAGLEEGSPRARAVLALVNEASLELLVDPAEAGGVGLDQTAASHIVEHRVGLDGVAGTDDDEAFDSLAELDAIPHVGPVTLGALIAYVVENHLCEISQEFELLLSNYRLRFTFGFGQHQGLAVRERRVGSDCGSEESIAYIFNHGRTVNTGAGNFRIIGRQKKVFAAGEDAAAQTDYMATCMLAGAAADGFCDSMCGNDGYTFPPSLIAESKAGTGGSSNDRFTARNQFPGDQHRRKGVWDIFGVGNDYPAYGHNSNNDAEAQNLMFHRCDWSQTGDPAAFDEIVTGVCESRCGGDFGPPGNPLRTNIAREHAVFCDGCMNLPADLPGDITEPRMPLAGSHGVPFDPPKRVHGM